MIFLILPVYVYGKGASTLSKNPIRARIGDDKFEVDVSVSNQTISVYKDGKLIRSMICSTGLVGDQTPYGHFKIDDYYGLNFYSDKYKEGGKYWVGFIGAEYLFHSVPTNKEGQIIESEAEKLGTRASHGCIRMSVYNARWFYDTIPQGSDVFISK